MRLHVGTSGVAYNTEVIRQRRNLLVGTQEDKPIGQGVPERAWPAGLAVNYLSGKKYPFTLTFRNLESYI